ncbi:SUKH-4 family immunity protein [Streptomyces sp. GMY02]|uniref:SUKH-4 family immunity protein n=1 Tax=Streptomyces sp. GMY02 TaxID=1333528 RepID=UPI001C2C724C|nr:SUKH-4 family immunity protein [Streptomyces sp. GMY02]QXE33042.1 SUKH-4 family immunity protein [Streptomyces sp. GMY02]
MTEGQTDGTEAGTERLARLLNEAFGADQVVRVDPERLHPAITHEPTRAFLTGTGLMRRAGLLRLTPDPEGGARQVSDLFPDDAEEAEDTKEFVVLGRFVAEERNEHAEQVEDDEHDSYEEYIVLDGRTGRIHALDDPSDSRLLASGLHSFTLFALALEWLRTGREIFEEPAGRYGSEAVAESTETLLGLMRDHDPALLGTEYEDMEVSPFWRLSFLLSPLTRIAAPGGQDGLALALPEGLLEKGYGADAVVRFADEDLPSALTHEPTRAFLRDTGLVRECVWVSLDDGPLRTLAEHHAAKRDDETYGAPAPGAEGLIRIGYLVEDIDLVIDGATGRVRGWFIPDARLQSVNADVSTLAFTQWLIARVRAFDREHGITDDYPNLAATTTAVLAAVDPVARSGDDGDIWQYWPEVFPDEAGGGLYA